MSSESEYEEVSFSEPRNEKCLNKENLKLPGNTSVLHSKIPVRNVNTISDHTYDYEKLMSLISSKRINDSNEVHINLLNATNLPKNKASELPERLFNLQQLSDNRIRFKRIEQENKAMEDCTFAPKINNTNPRRSFRTFLENQQNFQKKKRINIDKQKVILSKEKLKHDELDKKFEISPGSQKIITQKNLKKQTHQRLYDNFKTHKKSFLAGNGQNSRLCFSPDFKGTKLLLLPESHSTEPIQKNPHSNLHSPNISNSLLTH
jgi:hypothetical protein